MPNINPPHHSSVHPATRRRSLTAPTAMAVTCQAATCRD